MAKKNKNKQHKMACARQRKAAEEVGEIGLSLSDDIFTVGFVFEHLAISQLTYLGIHSINELCRKYAGIDIAIFTQHMIPPCVVPTCPVFNTSRLISWGNYPLITTSIGTTTEALITNASKIYHYVFDLDFIDNKILALRNINSTFCDNRVEVITRHESHKEVIEREFGIKVCDTIIPDCNVDKLVRIAITETKNG